METRTEELLTDDMLKRFDERAPVYDRENRFFTEDFEELQGSGYLLATVPEEFGGSGLGLDEYSQLQRRLAYVAPATALAVNMHCYWTGVASDLLRMGDESCRWILEEAAAMKADLIVMTSHRPAMRTYFLGSNAGHVVRYAKCSVLVVRH